MASHHENKPGALSLVDRADHKAYHKIYHPDGSGGRKKWGGARDVVNNDWRFYMRKIKGLDGLLAEAKNKTLPDIGWLYVDKDFNLESKVDILNKNYYLAESRDESFDMEENDKIRTFLESPTFCDIIDNKLEHHPNASKEELLEAVIYYLENDDFLD